MSTECKWRDCLDIVKEMYLRGDPVREIAKRCGGYSTVYRALRELGIRLRRGPGKPHHRIGRREAEEIARLYKEGRTVYEIARALGLSPQAVYVFLKRSGLRRAGSH